MKEPIAGASAPAGIVAPSTARLLAGLTGEQREAVCHGPGPLLIVAGPGTGKTRTLICRIAWLLASGAARPWEILAVTFSVRAADELRLRLQDLLGVEPAAAVRAATFHSVCARILREHAPVFGRTGEWTMYDQTEVRRTIDWLICERERGQVGHAAGAVRVPAAAEIQREISAAKSRLLGPAEYERSAEHPAAAVIAAVWRELDAEMRRLNAMDFDDLLVLTVGLLAERPHVLAALRERCRWLVVDELQDSCPAQLELTALLAGAIGNVTAVGDPDQVVYGWRAADAQGMRKLGERFVSHRRVVLSRNFRSRAEIVAAAARCVRHNPGREPRALLAVRGPGGQARAIAFSGEREEAAWIGQTVGQALRAGTVPGEVLLLARTAFATRAVQDGLARAGIPHRVLGSLGLYERAEVRDALAYLGLVANSRDARAFARAVSSPRRGVGERTQSRIVALARERHAGDLIRACADRDAAGTARPAQAREKLARFATGLEAARTQLRAGRSLSHVTIAALTMPGGVVGWQQWLRDHDQNPRRRRDAERTLDDLRSLCRHIQTYEQQEPQPTPAGFLEQAAGLNARPLDAGEEDRRVTISTIHSSKGSEASLVVLVGGEERLLPIWRALETPDPERLEEERRLFYVACTRAKDRLLITHCAHRAGRRTGGPSRFLAEAGLIARPTRTAGSAADRPSGLPGGAGRATAATPDAAPVLARDENAQPVDRET